MITDRTAANVGTESFDAPGVRAVLAVAEEMLRVCIDAGGTLSGEHGIGSEKNEYMGMLFSDADLEAMKRLRTVFNPEELCNPGKVFPSRHCRFF